MTKVPTVKFNNGKEIPILGLGTWKSKPGEVTQAVKDAIDAGYRHIDCAFAYGNEKEVGAALAAKISEGVVRREDLFIVSKLWCTHHRPDLVEPILRQQLASLGLEYLDLYLIHGPFGFKEGDEKFPRDANGKVLYSDVDYIDTWKAMEKVYEKGLAKSIGISNFSIRQVERVLSIAKIVPATNQIEFHPYLDQTELKNYCESKGITITAYCPLGSPDRPFAKPEDPDLLNDAKLKEIAKKYNKTLAQVLLRYQVQLGNIVIPKSVNKTRIEQNINIFDFELSKTDMDYIKSFNCNFRICAMLEIKDHKYYQF